MATAGGSRGGEPFARATVPARWLVITASIALVALGLALTSVAAQQSLPGILANAGAQDPGVVAAPGILEWAVLAASAGFSVFALLSLRQARRLARVARAAEPAHPDGGSVKGSASEVRPAAVRPSPGAAPVPVPALLRLLSDDERRLYLEIRTGGGAVYQRDLVARGTFSRAKVTRLLDKLEAKGLVARQRHGMTNRVVLLDDPFR